MRNKTKHNTMISIFFFFFTQQSLANTTIENFFGSWREDFAFTASKIYNQDHEQNKKGTVLKAISEVMPNTWFIVNKKDESTLSILYSADNDNPLDPPFGRPRVNLCAIEERINEREWRADFFHLFYFEYEYFKMKSIDFNFDDKGNILFKNETVGFYSDKTLEIKSISEDRDIQLLITLNGPETSPDISYLATYDKTKIRSQIHHVTNTFDENFQEYKNCRGYGFYP